MTPSPLIHLRDVTRRFEEPPALAAIDAVSLEIRGGEIVAIVGRSGSGKSTLLQLMGALDDPDTGEVRISDVDPAGLSDGERATLRRESLGFVFQSAHLVPTLSVAENVALTAIVAGHRRRAWGPRADELLEQLGLATRGRDRPSALSGGERQRVALARAVFSRPDVLLADEPTGALDSATASQVHALLRSAMGSGGTSCVVIVTHDLETACIADRVVVLRDGRITADRCFARPDSSIEEVGLHEERLRRWLAEHR
jgi:ABC-type lipoprotein export system ATPase subunit